MAASNIRRLPIVVVAGATGTGKSKLALELGRLFSGEIISADSMQIYKGLDIITNKVTKEEKEQCPHHLIDFVSPLHTKYTVMDFQSMCIPLIDKLLKQQKLPIIVGGTNYYIEALLWKFLITPEEIGHIKENSDDEDCTVPNPSKKMRISNTKDIAQEENSKKNADSVKNRELADIRNWGYEVDAQNLHDQLKEVDPISAQKIHPHDQRKIMRALEVFGKYGIPMSQILSEQHEEVGMAAISGPLRYPNSCIFWVQCDQEVLNKRLDDRVDKMIEQGLISELLEFHKNFNESRIREGKEADYTLGIFQSIGFKEFHSYLILPEEERKTNEGKKLFEECVENLKIRTRRYARKQIRWLKNRVLKRTADNTPHVYTVDSTEPSKWYETVHQPAVKVLQALIKGEVPDQKPLELAEESKNKHQYNVCDICDGLILTTEKDWIIHTKSRKHKRNCSRKKALEAIKKENFLNENVNSKDNSSEIVKE